MPIGCLPIGCHQEATKRPGGTTQARVVVGRSRDCPALICNGSGLPYHFHVVPLLIRNRRWIWYLPPLRSAPRLRPPSSGSPNGSVPKCRLSAASGCTGPQGFAPSDCFRVAGPRRPGIRVGIEWAGSSRVGNVTVAVCIRHGGDLITGPSTEGSGAMFGSE